MTTPTPSPEHVPGGAVRRLVGRALGAVGRRWRRSPVVFGAVAALVLGLGIGSAYAYFSATGLGTGTVNIGKVTAVTVLAATGTPSSKLHPGASADLTLTVKNPNTFAVTITKIFQNGTPGVSGGTACTSGNAGVTVPTQTGISVTVTPGTSVVVHIANGASMALSSANGCQGATFHVPVLITVEK